MSTPDREPELQGWEAVGDVVPIDFLTQLPSPLYVPKPHLWAFLVGDLSGLLLVTWADGTAAVLARAECRHVGWLELRYLEARNYLLAFQQADLNAGNSLH